MKALTAREIIRREYSDSKNFMTPTILKRGKMCRNIAYELSQGTGLEHQPIFGVSIVMVDESNGKTERLYNDSHVFETLDLAQDYIADYKQRC